jgi:hypothetical protein
MPVPICERKTPARSLTRVRVVVCGLLLTGSVGACSTVLGLSDFEFRSDESEAGSPDAHRGPDARKSPEGSAGFDVRSDHATKKGDAGAPDADASEDVSEDMTSCDVDLASQCYPCTPTLNAQFLNACTSATCVPFDDTTRVTHLLPDGALPPLPSSDAGNDP